METPSVSPIEGRNFFLSPLDLNLSQQGLLSFLLVAPLGRFLEVCVVLVAESC